MTVSARLSLDRNKHPAIRIRWVGLLSGWGLVVARAGYPCHNGPVSHAPLANRTGVAGIRWQSLPPREPLGCSCSCNSPKPKTGRHQDLLYWRQDKDLQRFRSVAQAIFSTDSCNTAGNRERRAGQKETVKRQDQKIGNRPESQVPGPKGSSMSLWSIVQNKPNVRQDKLGKEDVREYVMNGNL